MFYNWRTIQERDPSALVYSVLSEYHRKWIQVISCGFRREIGSGGEIGPGLDPTELGIWIKRSKRVREP
jgi:hypothetical protein